MSAATIDDSYEATRDRLRKQADEAHPEAWIASDTEAEFIGIFRRLKTAPSKFGETAVCIFEDLHSGQLRSVWLNHAVLRNEMIRAKPQPGETVLIRYLGMETPEGGGNAYAAYRIVVDRPNDAGMDWRELDPDPDAPTVDEPMPPGVAEGADVDDIPF